MRHVGVDPLLHEGEGLRVGELGLAADSEDAGIERVGELAAHLDDA